MRAHYSSNYVVRNSSEGSNFTKNCGMNYLVNVLDLSANKMKTRDELSQNNSNSMAENSRNKQGNILTLHVRCIISK
jgi:hypothetical protein